MSRTVVLATPRSANCSAAIDRISSRRDLVTSFDS
jgi:hypothetical protein